LPRQDAWTHPAEADLLNASRTAPSDRNWLSPVFSTSRKCLGLITTTEYLRFGATGAPCWLPHILYLTPAFVDPGSRDVVGSSST
jgi:hypothetical protein